MPRNALHAADGEALAGECRRCATKCDRMVDVSACVEMRCSNLYSYIAPYNSREYMGCMRRVFGGEVDVKAWREAQSHGGVGGLKMTGLPQPQCEYKVEPAHEGEGPAYECVNPGFFDAGGADLDLRDFAKAS